MGTSFQGVEQYLAAADAVARQVLEDETRRYTVVGCVPRARTDRDCAGRYLARLGRSAFRRPLTDEEHRRFLDMAMATAQARSDFWSGLRVAVTASWPRRASSMSSTAVGPPTPAAGRR